MAGIKGKPFMMSKNEFVYGPIGMGVYIGSHLTGRGHLVADSVAKREFSVADSSIVQNVSGAH